MDNNPFKYAIDAVERMDYVGFADWPQRRREAINRLALANHLHEVSLSQAHKRGMFVASALIIFAEACFLFAINYHKWLG